MTHIELQGLTKRYDGSGPDEVQAVSELSFDIRPGEFMVLVGPSGCGKSTVLRMIAGLEDISEGELRFDGQRMNEVEARHRDVGMVFQNYALYPHMSVFENIAFPLRVRKETEAALTTRVREIAEMLSLGSLLERKPKQLSGGQRQRVALGRAIARQPRVFLFDEPLSNLDARLRIETRAELGRLQRQLGTSSVYVTHDHVEAMTMGHRIAVLKGGRLQQVGSPHELYANPDNAFVASFLGSPGMNFFYGTLRQHEGLRFMTDDESIQLSLNEGHFRGAVPPINTVLQLGVRSEDITPVRDGESFDFQAGIEMVEYVGHECLVFFKASAASEQLCSARAAADFACTAGSRQKFRLRSDSVFLFDDEGFRL